MHGTKGFDCDISNAVEARRTIHSYKPGNSIDHDLLREGLRLALLAPNHRMTNPWKFVLCGPQTRMELAKIHYKLKSTMQPQLIDQRDRELEKYRDKYLNPAGMVAFCRKKFERVAPEQEREDYASIACSIQNFTLFLASHGYGSKWSTGAILKDPEVYKALGISPELEELCGFVWMGTPEGDIPPQRRPALDDVLYNLP